MCTKPALYTSVILRIRHVVAAGLIITVYFFSNSSTWAQNIYFGRTGEDQRVTEPLKTRSALDYALFLQLRKRQQNKSYTLWCAKAGASCVSRPVLASSAPTLIGL